MIGLGCRNRESKRNRVIWLKVEVAVLHHRCNGVSIPQGEFLTGYDGFTLGDNFPWVLSLLARGMSDIKATIIDQCGLVAQHSLLLLQAGPKQRMARRTGRQSRAYIFINSIVPP